MFDWLKRVFGKTEAPAAAPRTDGRWLEVVAPPPSPETEEDCGGDPFVPGDCPRCGGDGVVYAVDDTEQLCPCCDGRKRT